MPNILCCGLSGALIKFSIVFLSCISGLAVIRPSGINGTPRYWNSPSLLKDGNFLPRHVNYFLLSTNDFFTCSKFLNAIVAVFATLMFIPHSLRNVDAMLIVRWSPFAVVAKEIISSVKSNALNRFPPIVTSTSGVRRPRSRSITIKNIIGDRGWTCFTSHVGVIASAS